jgi:hypothetical protein
MDFNPDDRFEAAVLTAGWHTMRVVEAEERTSSKGNPMMVVELQHPEQPDGIRIRDYLVATPAALWKVEQALTAMGLGDKFRAGRVTEADVRGRLARVELVPEDVDGYDRPLLRVGTWDADAVPEQQPAAAPSPHAHPDAPAPGSADDIPF